MRPTQHPSSPVAEATFDWAQRDRAVKEIASKIARELSVTTAFSHGEIYETARRILDMEMLRPIGSTMMPAALEVAP